MFFGIVTSIFFLLGKPDANLRNGITHKGVESTQFPMQNYANLHVNPWSQVQSPVETGSVDFSLQ